MRVTDDIHRVDGVRGANSYVVTSREDGLLLVDTGLPGNAPRIVEFVEQLGFKPQDIRTIVITHADPDHVGSVAELKRLTDAEVAIHGQDAPALAGERRAKKTGGAMGVVFKLLSPLMRVSPLQADRLLLEGDEIRGFHVIEVPGHTLGSIALYRPADGVVFSGDALLGDGGGRMREPRPALAQDIELARRSADRIREMHPLIMLPGHGEPVREAAVR
jgi:glyoxylase-like metal-dependent hydrolase (beta-lactamase superfamily II)